MIKLNISEVIDFYDNNREAGKHSNAIKTISGEEMGFALLKSYFTKKGINSEYLLGPCTTGRKKGHRLDGWFRVKEHGQSTLFQVEVKSWSFHGFSEKKVPLPVNATEEQLREVREINWSAYWDKRNKRFHSDKLDKVLEPMFYRGSEQYDVHKPLACLWVAIHKNGLEAPLFTIPCSGEFKEVTVFSMSNYLRACLKQSSVLELDMPYLSQRFCYLQKMFILE